MKKDDLYGRNGSNSSTPNSRSKGLSSVSSNQTESFKMFDINVKEVKKDIDDIFSHTKDRLKTNSKNFESSIDDIFKKASDRTDRYFKDVDTKIDQMFSSIEDRITKTERRLNEFGESVSQNISSSYDKAYSSIDNTHKRSVENRIKEEQKLADAVGKAYSSAFNTDYLNDLIDKANEASKKKKDKDEDEKENIVYKFSKVLKDEDKRGINIEAYKKLTREGIIDAIIAGGKEFTSIWMRRFEQGMDRIVNTYNETYHEVSVLTGTNQKDYREMQDSMKRYLKDNNLNSVIRISDVMKELHSAVKSGITDSAEAQTVAMQNSITKAINPFIDVTADSYKDMQLALGEKFVDSTNGIVKSVDKVAGQTRFVSKNINDMLEQFQPVIMNAKNDFVEKNMTETMSMIESLLSSGDITTEMANQMKQDAYNLMYNQYGMLSSGNVSDILKVTEINKQGINVDENMTGALKAAYEPLIGIAKSFENSSALGKSIGGTEYGFGNRREIELLLGLNKESLNKAVDKAKETENPSDSQKSLISKIEDTFTNLFKKDTWAENAGLQGAQFEQQFPDGFKVMKSMLSELKAITGLIAGNFIANKLLDGRDSFKNGSARAFIDMFKDDVGKKGFMKSVKEYAKVFGDDVLNKFKGSKIGSKFFKNNTDDVLKASSKLSKIAGKLAGPLAALGFLYDSISGSSNSEDWYGSNSESNKSKASIGSMIAGNGKGVGEGSFGEVVGNAGSNALKWGSAGAALGSVIPGLGTLVGGLAGAGIGGITGLIGGKRIGEVVSKIPTLNFIGKEINTAKEGAVELFGELSDVWNDSSLSFGDKIGSTFGTVGASITDAFKDTFDNIKSSYDESFIPDMINGFKDFGSKAKDVLSDINKGFDEFMDNPIEFIKEKGSKALNSLSDLGSKAIDKLEDAKDSVLNFFKDISDSSKSAYKKASKSDEIKRNNSKGSHASGLNYVPYDGYEAILHKGESVFNAKASKTINDLFGITATSVSGVSKDRLRNELKATISNEKQKLNNTESKLKGSRVREVLKTNDIRENFDTSDLERAIYAIGDKIVSAINKQGIGNKQDIIDRRTGTVNVGFKSLGDYSDPTIADLPV